jgi:hypothetical protein
VPPFSDGHFSIALQGLCVCVRAHGLPQQHQRPRREDNDGKKASGHETGGADGDVSLVIMLDLETEVEMKLPGRFKVSPQIAGAIKAVSGVVDVQTV